MGEMIKCHLVNGDISKRLKCSYFYNPQGLLLQLCSDPIFWHLSDTVLT